MLYMKTVLLGRCPTPPPPTTRTWWQTERGNTITSSQLLTAEVLVAQGAVHTTSLTSRRGISRSLSRLLLHSPCILSRLYGPSHPDNAHLPLIKEDLLHAEICREWYWTANKIMSNAFEYLKGFVNISYTCCSEFTVKEIKLWHFCAFTLVGTY